MDNDSPVIDAPAPPAKVRAQLRLMGLPTPQSSISPFNESWYLQTYPDVRRVVNQGAFTSGFEHYFDTWLARRCHIAQNKVDQETPEKIAAYIGFPLERLANPAPPPIDDRHDSEFIRLSERHHDGGYLVPDDLRVTSALIRRVMIIGSCFMQALEFTFLRFRAAKRFSVDQQYQPNS